MTKHKIIQTVATLKNLQGAKRFEFVAKCGTTKLTTGRIVVSMIE